MNEYKASDGMVFDTPEERAEYERGLGNTKRFIDRDKLLESLRESYDSAHEWYNEATDIEIKIRAEQTIATFAECILRVKAQPAADVQEVKHAHWEIYEDTDGIYGICSNCGVDVDFSHYGIPYPNCPFCRAYMHGKEKAND